MPIIDYIKKAEQNKEFFFNRKDISNTNKNYIKAFLDQYDVSPARVSIFLSHIGFILKEIDDIKSCFDNKGFVNGVYSKLRKDLNKSYYSTIVNVSLRFVRWLNDGEKPKAFKDIQNISKKDRLRDLKPCDMVTWEDGINLVNATASMQLKAIIMTQLDGGFRPSEFIDMKYGDIAIKKNFAVADVSGKTGRRSVILFKCVPYLMRWLQNHPTKKKEDPLWIMEFLEKSHKKGTEKVKYNIRPYEYCALTKRILLLGEKIKLKKPLDFYNLRHSACTIAKKENLNPELAAQKFGHTVEYFVGTYGRLSLDDNIDRFKTHYGMKKEEQRIEQNVLCSKCDNVNVPKSEICEKCGAPLTLKKAMEIEDKQKDMIINLIESQLKKRLRK